jgi:purine-nucleoside phosphorylase
VVILSPDPVRSAVAALRDRIPRAPKVAIILGSGLGGVADEIGDPVRIPYEEIPGFPRATVVGHRGALLFGRWNGVEVVVMQGRFHLYEGWGRDEVEIAPRVLRALGADRLLVTNAAGAIRPDIRAGDLMLISDHIDLMRRTPLTRDGEDRAGERGGTGEAGEVGGGAERGTAEGVGSVGGVGGSLYDPAAGELATAAAMAMGFELKSGVYVGVLGPSFETPAEIAMMRYLGADAVGMSTVPEVTVAHSLGMRVLGISCITNDAPNAGRGKLTHTEVLDVAGRASERMTGVIRAVLPGFAEL